jgi:CheY-like chemotaxis protein
LKTILLVDDSKFQRLANQRTLAKAGYEVLTAHDGEEGLRIARSAVPDLIILDMLLPGLTGVEVLKALRQCEQTCSVPILVLSGLAQKNEAKLLHEGACAYFEKSRLALHEGPAQFLKLVKETLITRDDRSNDLGSQNEPHAVDALLIATKLGDC